MKKLVFLTLAVCISLITFGQTGTIVDKETYIQVNYPTGDTMCIGKKQVVSLKTSGNDVYVMTSQNWSQDAITRIASMNYSTFGFASVGALRSHLSAMCFNHYRITYHYTSDLVDTITHYAGDSTAYQVIYSYSGTSVSQKKIINP